MTAPRVALEMRRELPATLQAAEEFIRDFQLRSRTLLDRADGFAAELLLREALTNAVVHGCRAVAGRQVRCSVRCAVRVKGRRLLIAVEDCGPGFDWRAAWDKQAQLADCSGRGIEIFRKYSSGVRYNDRGNAMAVVRRLL
jgi:anti-sigma regulatory factor (Ser/Thr protein kinase)